MAKLYIKLFIILTTSQAISLYDIYIHKQLYCIECAGMNLNADINMLKLGNRPVATAVICGGGVSDTSPCRFKSRIM